MPRNKKRKTDRGVFSADVMKTAVKEVLEQKRAVRTVAKEFGLSRATLSRYVDDAKESGVGNISYKKTHATNRP